MFGEVNVSLCFFVFQTTGPKRDSRSAHLDQSLVGGPSVNNTPFNSCVAVLVNLAP